MNSSTKSATEKVRAINLKISKDTLQVLLQDGRIIIVPLAWYPRLQNASIADLKKYEWIGKGLGIHWSVLDEDLSIEGFLQGLRAPANQFSRKKQPTTKFPRRVRSL